MRSRRLWTTGIVVGIWVAALSFPSVEAAGLSDTPTPAPARIVGVEGEVTLVPTATHDPRPVTFRDALEVGDRVSTSEASAVEMLIATHTVVTLRSRSALTVLPARHADGQAELEVLQGSARVSAGSLETGGDASTSVTLWTPHARVTLTPGTLLEIEVDAQPVLALAPSPEDAAGRPVRTALHDSVPDRFHTLVETFSVLEGTADVWPTTVHAKGSGTLSERFLPPFQLSAGQRVRLVDGSFGPQTASLGTGSGTLSERFPTPFFPLQHTTTPAATTELLLARETYQAQMLLKLWDPTAPTPPVPNNFLQAAATWTNTGTSASSPATSALAGNNGVGSPSGIGGNDSRPLFAASPVGTPAPSALTAALASPSASILVSPTSGQTVTINGDFARFINTTATFPGLLVAGGTLNLTGHLVFIDPSHVLFSPPNGALRITSGTTNAPATVVTVLGDTSESTAFAMGVPLVSVLTSGKLNMTGNPGLLNVAHLPGPGFNGGIFTSEFEVLRVNGSTAQVTSTNRLINVESGSQFRVGFTTAGPPYSGPFTETVAKIPAVSLSGQLTTTNLLVVGAGTGVSNLVNVNGNLLKVSGSTSTATISQQLLNSTPESTGTPNMLTFQDYLVNLVGGKLVLGSGGTLPGVHVEGLLTISDGTNTGGGLLLATSGAEATIGVAGPSPKGFVEIIGAPIVTPTAGNATLVADGDLFNLQNTAKLTLNGAGVRMNATNANGNDGDASLTTKGSIYKGISGSQATFTRPIVDMFAAGGESKLTAGSDAISLANTAKLTAGGATQVGPNAVISVAASEKAQLGIFNGGIFNATGGTATFNSHLAVVSSSGPFEARLRTEEDVIRTSGGLTSLTINGSEPALFVSSFSDDAILNPAKGLLKMTGGSSATFGGTLAKVQAGVDATLDIGDALNNADAISMTGGTLKVNGTGPAIEVRANNTAAVDINGGGVVNMNGGNATFAGNILKITGTPANLIADATLIRLTNNATLAVNGVAAIDVDDFITTTATLGGGVFSNNAGTATFADKVLYVHGDSTGVSATDPLFRQLGSAKLTVNGAGVSVAAILGASLKAGGGIYNGANNSEATFTGKLTEVTTATFHTFLTANANLIVLTDSAKLTAGDGKVINVEADQQAMLDINNGGVLNQSGNSTAVFNSNLTRVFSENGSALLTTDETVLRIAGFLSTLTVNGPEAALEVRAETVASLSSAKGLLSVNAASATFGGLLALVKSDDNNATLNIGTGTGSDAIAMTGGTLKVNGTGPAIEVRANETATLDINGGGILNMNGGNATFAGTLAIVNGDDAMFTADATLIRMINNASLAINGTGSAIDVSDGAATINNGGVLNMVGGTAGFGGTVFHVHGGEEVPALTAGDTLFRLSGNAKLTVGGSGVVLNVDSVLLDAPVSLVVNTGGLYIGANFSEATFGGRLAEVHATDSATVTLNSDAIKLADFAKLTAGNGRVIDIEASEDTATLDVNNGGLFNATGGTAIFNSNLVRVFSDDTSTLTTDETVLRVSGFGTSLTVNGPEAAIHVEGDFGATVGSAKGLLSVNAGSATFGGLLALVRSNDGNATLNIGTGTGTDAIAMTGGTLKVNGTGPAIEVWAGETATLDINGGGILNMNGGNATFPGTLAKLNGSRANLTADATLIRMINNATLAVNGAGNAIHLDGGTLFNTLATINNGGVANINNAMASFAGTVFNVSGTIPTVVAGDTLFRLSGNAKLTTTNGGRGITVDETHGGAASLTVNPGGLYNGINSSEGTFSGRLANVLSDDVTATMTLNDDAIKLADLAKLTAGNGVVINVESVDNASLDVNNGGLFNATGGTATFNSNVARVISDNGSATLSTDETVLRVSGALTNLTVNGTGAALHVEGDGSPGATLDSAKGLLTLSSGVKATFAGTLALIKSSGAGATVNIGELATPADAISMTGGTLNVNGTGPAIKLDAFFDPGSLTIKGGGILMQSGGTATFAGHVLENASNVSNLTADQTLFRLSNAAILLAGGTGVLLDALGNESNLTVNNGGLYSGANSSQATFTGRLADLDATTEARLIANGNLISLTDLAKLTAGNGVVIRARAEDVAQVDVNFGGVLNQSGGTATFNSRLVHVDAGASTAELTTDETVLRVAGALSTLTVNGPEAALSVKSSGGPALLDSAKGLLSVNAGSATFGGLLALITSDDADATLKIGTGTGSDAIAMTGGTLKVNGTGPAIEVRATNGFVLATAEINGGGVLNMNGGNATFAGTILKVAGGVATLITDGTLIRLASNASLAVNGVGAGAIDVDDPPEIHATVGGGVFSSNGATATFADKVLYVHGGGSSVGLSTNDTLFRQLGNASLTSNGIGVSVSGTSSATLNTGGGVYNGANTSQGTFAGRLTEVTSSAGFAGLFANTDLIVLTDVAKLTAGSGIHVVGNSGRLIVNGGGVFNASGSSTAVFNDKLLEVGNTAAHGHTIAGETVVRLTNNASLMVNGTTAAIAIADAGIEVLNGGILDITNSTVKIGTGLSSSLADIKGEIIAGTSGDKYLASVNGGSASATFGGDMIKNHDTCCTGGSKVGGLLNAQNSATVTAGGRGLVLDNMVFKSTMNLVKVLTNATVTMGGTVVEGLGASQFNMAGAAPGDAVVLLNAGKLTASALFNLSGTTVAKINNFNLLNLLNTSTATLNHLFVVNDSASLLLGAGSLASFGAGANTLNIIGAACGAGCVLQTYTASGQNFNVALRSGALPAQVVVDPVFVPFQGLSVVNKVTIPANVGLFEVNGIGATVNLKSTPHP